jgi:hypothetical protein
MLKELNIVLMFVWIFLIAVEWILLIGKDRAMKQPRKPTREQKILLVKNGYDPMKFGIVREKKNEDFFKAINVETKEIIKINY